MSFAPQIRVNEGEWVGNALRFATREEAQRNVLDLQSRWVLVTDTRVVESTDPVNYRWTDRGLVRVEGAGK